MEPQYLYLIDGHSQIHRAYHARMQSLSGPAGSCLSCTGEGTIIDPRYEDAQTCDACNGTTREPTKATYVFVKQLSDLVQRKRPAYLAVCNDGPRGALRRRQIDPSYKAHRVASTGDLTVQIKRIKQLVKLLGVAQFEVEGYEADDIIATLTKKCVSDDVHIRIVSRDKDLACLLADHRVKLYDPSEDTELGPEWVRKRFGVEPCQMNDYLWMVGDTVDGITGVPGLGPKTAVSLLKEFGSFMEVLERPQDLSERLQDLTDPWKHPEISLSQQLVELDYDVPLRCSTSKLICKGLDYAAAAPVLRSLGFRRLK